MAQRILVVDDDREIVHLVQMYLQKAGFEVVAAYDGDEALQVANRDEPDLIVLDLMLPVRDGMEIARQLRSDVNFATTPILMLTARSGDNEKVEGLEQGADDYLTKPFNPQELVARVKAILRRSSGSQKPAEVIQVRGLRVYPDWKKATIDEKPVELTQTEFDILRTLAQRPDHAFSRVELVETALGYQYDGFESTIDGHVESLRNKIEADPSKPDYLETVPGTGYRLRAG